MSNIPDSWIYALLSEIALIQMGQSPNSRSYNNKGEGLPFFQGKADFGKLFPTARKWCTEPEKLAEECDILLSVRAPVGPTNLAAERCCIGRGLAAIQAIPPFNQKSLLYYFRYIEPWLSQQGTGTTFAGIGSKVIQNLEIPVAPLNEQKRIADKLDSLLARVDACRDRLDRVPYILQCFRQSVLAAATSGKLTEDWRDEDSLKGNRPVNWDFKIFGELVENSLYGPRFSAKDYSANGIPTIRTTDMDFDGTIVLRDTPRVLVPSQDFEKWGLMDGDLLVTRTGSTIGKCAIYQKSIGAAVPGAYLIRFRLNQHDVIPKFVLFFLLSPQGQSLLVNGSTSVAQPNINAKTISQFLVPIPPLSEQREIVRRVEDLFTYVERLEVRYQNALRQVEGITSALLSTAFRGKLVPQNPNDEPAAVLLERIRAEQIAKPKRVVVNRKPKMPKMTEESVKEVIRQLPSETFSFDELREKISGDYDSFKDILFTLLNEAEPSLMQVFDQEAEAMRFVRRNQ